MKKKGGNMSENTRWQDFNSIARNRALKSTEKALLLVIFSYNSAQKGYSYPSIETLMLETPIKDKTTFFKNRKSLVEKGYLRIETIKGIECHYFVIIPSLETIPSMETPPSRETIPLPSRETIPLPSRETIPQKEKKILIKENNIYSHWNSKNIIVHKSLTKEMEKAIEKVLKKYSEDEIIQAIDTYSEILNSDFYFNYKWSLIDFLNRKNGIGTFMEEGSNKVNYETWKREGENNANTKRNTIRDRGCFNEGAEDIKIELPKREFRHYTNEELEELGID